MHPTLDKFSDLVVADDDAALETISAALMTASDRKPFFGGSHLGGWFYLYRVPALPDLVMEATMSPRGDTLFSLYRPHPALASVSDLIKAREEVVRALAEKIGLSPENIGITDHARGRLVGPGELALGQMLDLLAERTEGYSIQEGTLAEQLVMPDGLPMVKV